MQGTTTQPRRRYEETLPQGWTTHVKSSVLHVMALAHCAIVKTRARIERRSDPQARKAAEIDGLRQKIATLQEESRIKDSRMNQIPAQQRPRYQPVARMAILELKATQGWSLAQTAKRFLVTPATVSSWQRRIDEDGPDALVQLPRPVNQFPEYVGHIVQKLKTLCPTLGKRKIAAKLARAGLHLSATTVSRMLHDKPHPAPQPPTRETLATTRVVTAKRPNHVWHVDLTTVTIGGGFWVPWLPLALPQCWPFCWWVAVVVDHYSRRVMGSATFAKQPSSADVCAFLGRAISKAKAVPKYVICDRGSQFDCRGFRRWCKRRKIKPRYGAIGRHGSIAVVERFIRTLKESLRRLALIPMTAAKFRQEVSVFMDWYNEHRPHDTLGGRTPNEVYHHRFPANRKPRHEPRERWPRASPCAKLWALTCGRPGAALQREVAYHAGPDRHAQARGVSEAANDTLR